MSRARPELGSLSNLLVVEAVEFQDWRPQQNPIGPSRQHSPELLTDIERRFLKAVIDHPGQPSGKYAKLARIGPAQAVKARRRLVELGVLREHQVNTGARGRSSIVVEPLSKAHDAARAAGGV